MTAPLATRLRRTRGMQKVGLLRLTTLDQADFSAWHAVREQVAIYSGWATLVWMLHSLGWMPMTCSAGMLVGIFSMVTGLLVSFRATSSYERWYEGRRTWQAVQATTRNLIRTLVFALPPPSNSPYDAQRAAAVKELCSLVCAYPFALMYRLRDQPGIDHAELRALLPDTLLEAYRATPLQARSRPSVASQTGSFTVESSKAPEEDRAIEALNAPPSTERFFPRALPSGEPTNLPLSLIRAMQAYLSMWHEVKLPSRDSPSETTSVLDGVTFAAANNALNQLTDSLTALERIRDTPIPLILQIHLQLLLLVYVGAVPLQLVRTIGIWCIPATAVSAAVFFGIDRAAEELSDPFGTEPNDLPIGRFCADLHREYLEMIGEGGGSSGNSWEPSRPTTLSASTAVQAQKS
ncbi:hypothetical protein BMF94_5176 [Rhodotorula taiwanensis]|uniref:Uncharacterized protein n=1 Tax=Rhodotorula taiwanensis TaxID=741276 RepID=A0A2S5B501_9BASI|nr:hypothetical protein BMF94_5176 [Rhodotorula taiwanensis]